MLLSMSIMMYHRVCEADEHCLTHMSALTTTVAISKSLMHCGSLIWKFAEMFPSYNNSLLGNNTFLGVDMVGGLVHRLNLSQYPLIDTWKRL